MFNFFFVAEKLRNDFPSKNNDEAKEMEKKRKGMLSFKVSVVLCANKKFLNK